MSNETNTTANWTGRAPRTMSEAFKDASYGSPYCPGDDYCSDPWFVGRVTLLEELLGIAFALSLVGLCAWAFYAWFIA